jgi:hypothetical protein
VRKTIAAMLLLIAASVLGAAEGTIHASGTATGDVILGFTPTLVSAQIDGRIRLIGSMELDGVQSAFDLEGRVGGSARGSLADLSVAAWIAIEAQGIAKTGDPVVARGGIEITELTGLLAESASGTGAGRFYLVVTCGNSRWIAEGPATGSASGQFVIPDDPSTMQARGTAAFSLAGTARPWPAGSPTEIEAAEALLLPPEEWSQALLDLFDVASAPPPDGAQEG